MRSTRVTRFYLFVTSPEQAASGPDSLQPAWLQLLSFWQTSCFSSRSMEKALNDNPQQHKPKSKRLAVIAAAIAFLVLGGGGYWYASNYGISILRQSKKAAAKTPGKDAPPAAVLQLHNFVVNLADPDHGAFLRVGIALGLDKPLPAEGNSEKDSPYTPQIRDAILCVLATWKSGELLAPDGRSKLKKQLLNALQRKIPELGVVDVYLTDFLIQQ